jgi:hypothetical protein
VSLEKIASSQLYHRKPILITSPVVVDSAGVDGIFWTGNDAIDAAGNANRSHVYVLDGTYDGMTIDHTSMLVECASARSSHLGIGSGNPRGAVFQSTSTTSVTLTGTRSHLKNCGVFGFSGGGSGGASAIGSSALFGVIEGNVVIDADNVGIYVNARTKIINNIVADADGACYYLENGADWTILTGNYGSPCSGSSLTIHANAENNIGVGNIWDGTEDDNSGTSTMHNELF